MSYRIVLPVSVQRQDTIYLQSSVTAPLFYCFICKEKHVGKNMFGSLCQIFTYELLTSVHTVDEIHLL